LNPFRRAPNPNTSVFIQTVAGCLRQRLRGKRFGRTGDTFGRRNAPAKHFQPAVFGNRVAPAGRIKFTLLAGNL